jgi:hypothetical protein
MTKDDQTDIAALGAGVISIAVTILAQDGPFHPIESMISATLAVVILAYVGERERNGLKRVAFAMVMGTILIPIIAVFFEDDFDSKIETVTWKGTLIIWVAASAIVAGIDSVYQRRRK